MTIQLEAIKLDHDPASATFDALNVRRNASTAQRWNDQASAAGTSWVRRRDPMNDGGGACSPEQTLFEPKGSRKPQGTSLLDLLVERCDYLIALTAHSESEDAAS